MTSHNTTSKWPYGWTAVLTSVVVCVVLCLALFHATLFDMVKVWNSSPTYTHGYFIAPITIGLIWMRRHYLRQSRPSMTPLGFGLIAIMLGGHFIGTYFDFQVIQHFALVGLVIAIIVTLIGISTARLIFFPLAFLFFSAPAGEELVPLLQNFTAGAVVLTLNILNIPVFQDGVYLYTPTGDFEVAEACAGLRFLVATIMVATLFAYLSYNSWRKKLIFMAAAFILPILANALRAIAIVLIATWSNHKYAVGFDHLVYGWGFFAVILLILLFSGNKFSDKHIKEPQVPLQNGSIASLKSQLWLSGAIISLLCIGAWVNSGLSVVGA